MRLAALILSLSALPAAAQGIVPLDGLWTTEPTVSEIGAACPEAIRPMLQPMLSMMDQARSEEIAWGGTFDPQAMAGAEMEEGVTWTRDGDDAWTAEMRDPDLPGSGPVVAMRMEAVAPDRIESRMAFDIGMMMGADATDMQGNPVDATGCMLTMEAVSTHGG